jgi:hypothetical protein
MSRERQTTRGRRTERHRNDRIAEQRSRGKQPRTKPCGSLRVLVSPSETVREVLNQKQVGLSSARSHGFSVGSCVSPSRRGDGANQSSATRAGGRGSSRRGGGRQFFLENIPPPESSDAPLLNPYTSRSGLNCLWWRRSDRASALYTLFSAPRCLFVRLR